MLRRQWKRSSSGMCCGLCLKVITSLVFSNPTKSSFAAPFRQQSHNAPYKGGRAAQPPALSAVCKGWGANQPRAERTEPGTAVGPGHIIRLVPEQTDPSGRELGLGGVSQWDLETLCPWNCTLSFFSFVFFFFSKFYWRIVDLQCCVSFRCTAR